MPSWPQIHRYKVSSRYLIRLPSYGVPCDKNYSKGSNSETKKGRAFIFCTWPTVLTSYTSFHQDILYSYLLMVRAITFTCVTRSISCLCHKSLQNWLAVYTNTCLTYDQTNGIIKILYHNINFTSFVLVLFHHPKYFQSPVWQDLTVVDSQGKKDVSYTRDSTGTTCMSKQKWIKVKWTFFTEFKWST